MPLTLAVARESADGESRAAISPETAKKFTALGARLRMEQSTGTSSHFLDPDYADVEFVSGLPEAYAGANLILRVTPPTLAEIAALPEASVLIGLLRPYESRERLAALNARRITAFSLELLPRISRAQSMDALSSQASCAGYQCGLIAAARCTKFFPMLTTAAGTIRPSKVLIVGAGVAGLQAIATARRLGAQVEGFDVRPETREQIESLGGKFLDLGVSAKGEGGYARELTAEERAEQQRRLGEHLKNVDVIVTTAAVPGRPAPKIVTAAMVQGMKPGSVIVDLAAETGGNCELTRPGETIETGGVTVAGPLNLASMGALHASEMYARNVFNFLSLMLDKEQGLKLDWEDELIAKTCLTHAGERKA